MHLQSTKLWLRILALILWSYIPIFLITFLALQNPHIGWLQALKPEVRGDYQWDFELMFVSIYLVWGWYLWKTSYEPKKHLLFINFSIWANISHGVVMVLIGFLRDGELMHLMGDSVVLFLPALALLYTKGRNE